MPLDLLQTRKQIVKKSQQYALHEEERIKRVKHARNLLQEYSEDVNWLITQAERASKINTGLRIAIPVSEPLARTVPAPEIAIECVILAADGSQIVPSRHDRIEFGVINTGVFRMEIESAQPKPPKEITRTRLILGDELASNGKPVTEDLIALWRDLDERCILTELASLEKKPVLTLTDGPLELYHEPRQQEEFSKLFVKYLEELRRMASMGGIVAGVIDKPRADLVVRLLEIVLTGKDNLDQAGLSHLLAGVTDFDVLSPLMRPGERSAIFRINSTTRNQFSDEINLHFFYLNTGFGLNNGFARIEIPGWVAEDPEKVDQLHHVLITQSKQSGSRPYPYALHRAHEIALIKLDDRQIIENMLIHEFNKHGVSLGEKSNKQFLKDQNSSRLRYGK